MLAGLPLIAQAVLPFLVTQPPAGDPCLLFDKAISPPHGKMRSIGARDQATMADIGRSDPYEAPSPFGVSPDGKSIAFVVRRGNPDANAFCQRLMVMPLDSASSPKELDRGGEFIRATFALRNFPAVRSGYAQVITPHWSPDGRSIAYLKRTDRHTQVWAVDAQGGSPARQLTFDPDDIDDFAWDGEGRGLIVATTPALRRAADAMAKEARSGYFFDDRFSPQLGAQPIPTSPMPTTYGHIDIASRSERDATPAESAGLAGVESEKPKEARVYASAGNGTSAWTVAKNPALLIPPTKLVLKGVDGHVRSCADPFCEGIHHLWWSSDGRRLYALQKTGWGASQLGLLRWRLGEAAPTRVFVTDDALTGCAMVTSELICAREGAAIPRRLVAIDPDTGHMRIIYDPNPQFQKFALGKVQRFRFCNGYGVESFADFVLPPNHKTGEKHPLVVVQYGSDGFLRGGTGDEVPIQVLAARGFAVLSFARPDFAANVMQAKTPPELERLNRVNWADRRSVESSLEMAIALAIGTGAVDAARMGISGFSDGTSTVQWALINSSLFKVASLGACCEDIYSYPLEAGPAFERFARDMGYRFFEPGVADYWKPMSLFLNADRIETPILIQTGDSEYEIGLDVLDAYRRRGKPIELYVLPGEAHFKWQPAHRLAIYARVVDWFAFWLLHQKDCTPDKAEQNARWQQMQGAPPPNMLTCASIPSPAP